MKMVRIDAAGAIHLEGGPTDSGPEESALLAMIAGDDVALHRMDLGDGDALARLEVARTRAIDHVGQPIDDLHIAIGPVDADGQCWVAIIARVRMEAHVQCLRDAGVTAAHVVPAALMLAGDGAAALGDLVLLRDGALAVATDPALLPLLTQAALPAPLPAFQPVLPSPLPIDLLQGEFAPRLMWWRLRWVQVASALLLLLIGALAAAPLVIDRARTATMVAGYDRATMEVAGQLLGQRFETGEAAAAALATARGEAEAKAITPRLALVANSIEAVPGSRLEAVRLQPDGALLLTLGGRADAVTAAGAQMTTGPFVAEAQGRTVTLAGRRTPGADPARPVETAQLRLAAARTDAALLAAAPKPQTVISQPQIAAAFVGAGLVSPPLPADGTLLIPAARAPVLLPLIADLERRGARITALSITANPDSTLSARIGFAP